MKSKVELLKVLKEKIELIEMPMEEIFDAIDADGNGVLDKHEFEDVLNMSLLSCPATIFCGKKSRSMRSISIMSCWLLMGF